MICTLAAWMHGGCSLDAWGCSLSCTREPEQVQRRSKALCLVEALLLADNAAARDYFCREMQSLQALLSSPQAPPHSSDPLSRQTPRTPPLPPAARGALAHGGPTGSSA